VSVFINIFSGAGCTCRRGTSDDMRVTSTTTMVNWIAIICVWNGVEVLRHARAVAVRFICRASTRASFIACLDVFSDLFFCSLALPLLFTVSEERCLKCSWISSLDNLQTDLKEPELSYSRFKQLMNTFFILAVGPKRSVNVFSCALEMLSLSYLLTSLIS